MQVTENLIQRFFDQQCTAEEADAVVSYLYRSPGEVVRWLGPDWKQAGKEIPVPALYRKEIGRRVREQICIAVPKQKLNRNIYLSVAAAILLVFCGSWFFSIQHSVTHTSTSIVVPKQVNMEMRANTTVNPITIHLPDGSAVTLEPGASIQYVQGFNERERKIILRGNGFFDVQKNADRPFSVVSGEITTTALGTSFRVIENEEGVTVKLYTGKVVINKSGSAKQWAGPVYLLPGTAMTYSVKQAKTTVAVFTPETKKRISAEINIKRNKKQLAGTEINFDNTPLQEVLAHMEDHFAIKIQYDQTVINNHYFTGKILPTDSAELLLHIIGNMNGLTIKKEASNRFLLVKN